MSWNEPGITERAYLEALERIGLRGRVDRALEMYNHVKWVATNRVRSAFPDLEEWRLKYAVAREIYHHEQSAIDLINRAEQMELASRSCNE